MFRMTPVNNPLCFTSSYRSCHRGFMQEADLVAHKMTHLAEIPVEQDISQVNRIPH